MAENPFTQAELQEIASVGASAGQAAAQAAADSILQRRTGGAPLAKAGIRGSVNRELDTIARQLRADSPRLSQADAFKLACKQNPELHSRFVACANVRAGRENMAMEFQDRFSR